MENTSTVFDEYIFENTISDFAEYLQSHLGLENLNENEIDSTELLYNINGKTLKVEVHFDSEDLTVHPVNQMEISMDISDLSLEEDCKKIYTLFDKFKLALNSQINEPGGLNESSEVRKALTPAEEMRELIEKSKEAGDEKFKTPVPDKDPEK